MRCNDWRSDLFTSIRRSQLTVRRFVARLAHPEDRGHIGEAERTRKLLSRGSDRGSPNHGSTVLSKRVMARIRSPARLRT